MPSSESCRHSTETGGLLLLPVGPLWSRLDGLPPSLRGRYAASPLLRGSPPLGVASVHPYCRPRGSSHLWLLRSHRHRGSHVPCDHLFQAQPTRMPDAAPSVKQVTPELVPESSNYPGFDIVSLFSTRKRWFPCGPLPGSHLTQVSLLGLFLLRSPPLPLGSSSGRWFESNSGKPVRGAFPHQS